MITSRTYSTYAGNMAWLFQTYNADATVDVKQVSDRVESSSIWSYEFQDIASAPPIFLPSESMEYESYPPNHPAWDKADEALAEIWANSEYVSPEDDAKWLAEIRASWDKRIESLYDESDQWE